MASLSSQYLVNNKDEEKNASSATYKALKYSLRIDLTGLMIATEIGMDRLTAITSSEANA